MTPPAVSQPLFIILSGLVEARVGLHYGPDEKALFLERAAARAALAGFDSLLDYYYFLRYDEDSRAELDKLIDALVINETYFFREIQPLRALVKRTILPMVERGLIPRIWSAACSTGEEPLTLAMLLSEAGVLGQVSLLASDVSLRALERARAGHFSRRSVREGAEPQLTERFIQVERHGLHVVDARLREAITWSRINLCDPTALPAAGSCDIILCRNVLIYFSDETAARVVEGLTATLRPGGLLLVGVSESLLRFGSALACQEIDQAFMYRKAA